MQNSGERKILQPPNVARQSPIYQRSRSQRSRFVASAPKHKDEPETTLLPKKYTAKPTTKVRPFNRRWNLRFRLASGTLAATDRGNRLMESQPSKTQRVRGKRGKEILDTRIVRIPGGLSGQEPAGGTSCLARFVFVVFVSRPLPWPAGTRRKPRVFSTVGTLDLHAECQEFAERPRGIRYVCRKRSQFPANEIRAERAELSFVRWPRAER